MLALIRNNVQSFFVKAVVVVVASVMLFFGINSYQDQGVNTLATIGDIEVKYEDYARAYEQTAERMRQSYGANAERLIEAMNLKGQVLNRLVNNALMVKAAARAGLAVSDQELAERLRELPPFQTDGRFDQAKYQDFLSNAGYRSGEFEAVLRRELLANKFLALVGGAHLVSQEYVRTIYRRDETAYSLRLISLAPQDLDINAQPTSAEIKEYYEQHPEQFQAPSQFKIKYFGYGLDEVKTQVSASDRAAALYYKQNKSRFTEPAAYKARHILIQVPQDGNAQGTEAARQKAQELHAQLQANPQAFAQLAKAHSQDPGSAARGGSLGWAESGQMVAPFEKQALDLEPGQISQPFLTQFGYHIVQLEAKRPAKVKPFEEVAELVKAQIIDDKAKRRLENWQAKAQEKLDQGGLAQLAQSAEQTVQESPFFDDRSQLKGLGNVAGLYRTLAEKKAGAKGVVQLGSKAVAYEVLEVKPPQTKPFEEVAVEAELMATTAKERQLTQAKLAQLEAQVQDPAAFQALAKQLNKTPKTVNFLYKDRNAPGLPAGRDFQVAVSALREGQVAFLAQGERGYAVHLVSKVPGVAEGNPQGLVQLKNQLARQKSEILISGLVEELRREVEVVYNDELLKNLEITG